MSQAALSFEQIHDDFRPRILRYLARMVGEDEAQDLTQQVFVKISRALPSFRGESRLSTWIYRIATNAALDRLRDPAFRASARNTALDASSDEGEDTVGRASAEMPTLEDQVCRHERFECFQGMIELLPANYRVVVALNSLEDLAADEIADILGLSVNVVKIRLHRGRMRLLKELQAHCRPEDWL